MCIKQKSDFFKKKKLCSYNFGWFLSTFITIFYATRIWIHVSWSGSGSGQMIRIRPYPDLDPKHCYDYMFGWLSEKLTDLLTDLVTEQLFEWLTDFLLDWLNLMTNWLNN